MNWTVIIIVSILALGLIIFTITRNQKDEKQFEKKLNDDYPIEKKQNADIEIEGKEI